MVGEQPTTPDFEEATLGGCSSYDHCLLLMYKMKQKNLRASISDSDSGIQFG